MQKFRFALQPVLQKRKMAYEQASRKLAIAQKELQTEFQILTDLQNQNTQLQADLKYRKQHQGFKAAEWTTYVGYFQHLDQRIRSQALIIEEKEKQVEHIRQEIQKAGTEYEVMIKMREKAQAEHRHQFLKEEQAFLDDLPKSNRTGIGM